MFKLWSGSRMPDAEFVRFLVDRGLHAAAATESMHELTKRYGISRWFDFGDVVYLPPASLFPEQREPFSFTPVTSCLLPPFEFNCDFDAFGDGPRNHDVALERLTDLFEKPERGQAVNTLEHTWTFEQMWLRILTFIPEKSRFGRNELYEAHPELWHKCRITVDCSRIRAMTAAEAAMLSSLQLAESMKVPYGMGPGESRHLAMVDRGLLLLDRDGLLEGGETILWKRGEQLGWRAKPWAAILERRLCKSVHLLNALPARGSGYSTLLINLQNPFSLEEDVIDTKLFSREPDQLDGIAPKVARFLGLPLTSETFHDD